MRFLIVLLILFSQVNLIGQQIDYNKIVLPKQVNVQDFKEKLVQLAWENHPDNINIRTAVTIAEDDLKLSKRQWLDAFKVQGNLNEFILNPSADLTGRANLYPKYNFGLTLSLGQLLYNPVENRQTATKITMADNTKKALMLEVRKNVLSAYNNYELYDEVYKIQSLALSDAETNHGIVEEAFKQGEESYDKYTLSLNNINQKKIAKLQAQNDMRNAKLVIESLIGRQLEEVN